jgi:ATP-dependent exoDNAse (exonuclease V) alpha subunit
MQTNIKLPLKAGQAAAFEQMKIFFRLRDEGMFLLQGYGGTGKSYLSNELISHLRAEYPFRSIAVTAPTHKALKVIRNFVTEKVDYSTTHALLGLREFIDHDGKQVFRQDKTLAKIPIDDYRIVIVDEASMLDDYLFDLLVTYVENDHKYVLFIGDPLQIPPVNHVSSMPFNKEVREQFNIETAVLRDIIRQKEGNPIIELSMEIRKAISRPVCLVNHDSNINGLGGVRFVKYDQKESFLEEEIYPLFKSEIYKENPDYVKIIAWTNKTVDSYNREVRKRLFGEGVGKICKGDLLIANGPILEDKKVLVRNNEEMRVLEYSLHENDSLVDGHPIKYYSAHVAMVDREEENLINILHEDSDKEFNSILQLLADYAKTCKKGSFHAASAWTDFYKLKQYFADIKYGYSQTTHKVQGSTYINAVVMEYDMSKNSNAYESNRILYTACTRPSDNLYVIYKDLWQ